MDRHNQKKLGDMEERKLSLDDQREGILQMVT